jgi:hypothetical protein
VTPPGVLNLHGPASRFTKLVAAEPGDLSDPRAAALEAWCQYELRWARGWRVGGRPRYQPGDGHRIQQRAIKELMAVGDWPHAFDYRGRRWWVEMVTGMPALRSAWLGPGEDTTSWPMPQSATEIPTP